MGSRTIQPVEPRAQAATPATVPSNPSPPAAADRMRAQHPPQSSEPMDYQTYTYGYPPVSGRMFGAGTDGRRGARTSRQGRRVPVGDRVDQVRGRRRCRAFVRQ